MFFLNSALARLLLAVLPGILGTLDPALSMGEGYLRLGLCDEAVTEYQRYLFFNAEGSQGLAGYAYFRIGIAYRNQGLWDKAVSAFEKSIQSETDDFVRERRRLDLGLTLLAARSYSRAEFLLLKLELFSPVSEIQAEAALYRGLCCLSEDKWEEAKGAFKSFSAVNRSPGLAEAQDKVKMILQEMESVRLRSPGLAKTLSTIIPGAGQIYSLDILDGLNALSVNAALFYLALSDLFSQRYYDALFNSLFLLERFYSGNRRNAPQAAQRFNHRQSEQIINKLLKTLEANERTPCPIS